MPSARFFPQDWAGRILWFNNFAIQFAALAAGLGLSSKVAQVTDDNLIMQFFGTAMAQGEAFLAAVRQYRRIITTGDIGDPTPDFPANPTLELPKEISTGIFERLDKLIEQIRAADGYTDEIGALLDILPQGEDSISPGDLKPALKGRSLPASELEIAFVRGKTSGVQLQMQIGDAAEVNAGNFFQSPAIIKINSATPVVVKIRGRYLDGNTPVGQVSDIISLVTQP